MTPPRCPARAATAVLRRQDPQPTADTDQARPRQRACSSRPGPISEQAKITGDLLLSLQGRGRPSNREIPTFSGLNGHTRSRPGTEPCRLWGRPHGPDGSCCPSAWVSGSEWASRHRPVVPIRGPVRCWHRCGCVQAWPGPHGRRDLNSAIRRAGRRETGPDKPAASAMPCWFIDYRPCYPVHGSTPSFGSTPIAKQLRPWRAPTCLGARLQGLRRSAEARRAARGLPVPAVDGGMAAYSRDRSGQGAGGWVRRAGRAASPNPGPCGALPVVTLMGLGKVG
jgi:hypothetical protein